MITFKCFYNPDDSEEFNKLLFHFKTTFPDASFHVYENKITSGLFYQKFLFKITTFTYNEYSNIICSSDSIQDYPHTLCKKEIDSYYKSKLFKPSKETLFLVYESMLENNNMLWL